MRDPPFVCCCAFVPDCEIADTDAPWRFTMRSAALLALALAGCSSPSSSGNVTGTSGTGGSSAGTGGPLTCQARSGSYSFRFAERSGSCGALPEQIVVLQAGASGPAPNCTGTATNTADHCSVDLDVDCVDAATGVHGAQRGNYTFTADGSRGQGTIQFTVKDSAGAFVCSSTYDVSISKI